MSRQSQNCLEDFWLDFRLNPLLRHGPCLWEFRLFEKISCPISLSWACVEQIFDLRC